LAKRARFHLRALLIGRPDGRARDDVRKLIDFCDVDSRKWADYVPHKPWPLLLVIDELLCSAAGAPPAANFDQVTVDQRSFELASRKSASIVATASTPSTSHRLPSRSTRCCSASSAA
jgi:hypothetical protein